MSIEYRGENKWRFRIRFEGRNYSNNYFSLKPPRIDNKGKPIIPSDVEKAHNAFMVDVQRGDIGLNGNVTFGEFYEIYTNEYLVKLEEATQMNIYYIAENHFLPYFKNLKLNDIKPIDVQRFFNKKAEEEYKPNKKYSQSTINIWKGNLKSIFNKAIEWELLEKNPCKNIKMEKSTKQNHAQIYSQEQLNILINAINKLDNLFYKALFSLALFGGFRKGEIFAIEIDNINFKDNSIIINKQATIGMENGKSKYKLKNKTKSLNSMRETFIPQFAMNNLREYIQSLPHLFNKFIFWNFDTNKIYNSATFNYALDVFIEKNNLPKLTPHKLRHLNATMLLKSGSDVTDVAGNLGDTIKTVTEVYLHDMKETRKKSAFNLESYVNDIAN